MALAGPSNLRLGLRLLTTRTAAPPAARTGKRTGSKEHRTAGPTRRAALAREHASATTRFPINQPESAQPYAARRLLTHEKKRPTPTLAPIKASVVYENEHFLVLNKPSGVAIQGQHGSTARRMWDALLDDVKSRQQSPEVFPVHRLDKSTTGCLVLAKNAPSASKLIQQFKRHEIQRSYIAIVHGAMQEGFKGEITTRLRTDEDQVRSCESEYEGLAALTRWEVLSASPTHSLLRLDPSTGRKHQLRVHCSETLQASIVGDFKYGPEDDHRELVTIAPDAILLHSLTTSFWTFAKTGKRSTTVVRAEPPEIFARFCIAAGLKPAWTEKEPTV